MLERIKGMGLDAVDYGDIIDVTGDMEKLRELRTVLDNEGYTDDTEAATLFMGLPGAKETISRILVCTVGGNGYMAVA